MPFLHRMQALLILMLIRGFLADNTWFVTTTTQNIPSGPGTKNDVRLQILGDKGKTRNLTITDSLLKGKTQLFIFYNVKDVGIVIGLRVELMGHDGWALGNITMENVGAERNYTFVFNSVLDSDDRRYGPVVVLKPEGGVIRPTTTSTTPSINDDVIIGLVAGVVGLLLVASAVMMYLYFGKKRRAEEQQKMAIEKERADMERETERQLEQQRAMEVESHYSESLTSMAMEVESLRMKEIQQQQQQAVDKQPDEGLVGKISTLMFGPSTTQQPAPQGHSSPSYVSVQQQPVVQSVLSPSHLSVHPSGSQAVHQDWQQARGQTPGSHLSVHQHPGRGQSPSTLMVHPSQIRYSNPQQF